MTNAQDLTTKGQSTREVRNVWKCAGGSAAGCRSHWERRDSTESGPRGEGATEGGRAPSESGGGGAVAGDPVDDGGVVVFVAPDEGEELGGEDVVGF